MDELVFTDDPGGASCPDCQVELHVCMVGGIKCVGCSQCRGLLLTGESFAALVQLLRSQYRGPDVFPEKPPEDHLTVQRNCPACGHSLDTHSWSGPGHVVIDACRECHLVWLDNHELTRIVRAPGRRT